MSTQPLRANLAIALVSVAFATVFLTLALVGFHQPSPHELPVGLVGPTGATSAIQGGLDRQVPGAFSIRRLPGEAQARLQIAHRELDGALIASPSGMTLLIARAGGTGPSQAIADAFTRLAAADRSALRVTDVVSPKAGDSQGLSSYFLILCVLFPSLAAGIAVGHARRGETLAARAGVLLGAASATGLAAAGIADGVAGLGHYWAIAGIIALFAVAVAAPTAALAQIKPQLVGLAVFAFLMVGIPVSGGPANLAAFQPALLRWLHPGLPLGIGVDAIRNSVYFHGSDTAAQLLVLGAFAAFGLAALGALAVIRSGAQRRRAARATATPVARQGGSGTPVAAVAS